MGGRPTPPARAATVRRRVRRLTTGGFFGLAFAACLAAIVSWSLATPLDAGPDEALHAVRAVSLVRGQLLGARPRRSGPHDPSVIDRVPPSYGHPYRDLCFLLDPDRPAGCAGPPTVAPGAPASGRRPARSLTVRNYVGRYPPLYYLLVGLPARWLNGSAGLRAMRLLSAVWCALLLAAALSIARRNLHRPLVGAGLGLAVTPLLLDLGGVINPSGLEISAAIAGTVAVLALAADRSLVADPAVVGLFGTSVALLAMLRTISPLWVAVLVGLLVLLVRPRRARGLLVHRAVRCWAVVDLAALGAAVAWDAYARPFGLLAGTPLSDTSVLHVLDAAAGRLPTLLGQTVGVFGAANVPSPPVVRALWYCGLGVVVVVAAAGGTRRGVTAVVVAAAAWVVVAVAVPASRAGTFGLIGQGRDFMAVAVLTPLVAGAVAADGGRRRALHRALVAVTVALAVGRLTDLYWALRTVMVGHHGPIDPGARVPDAWSPPLPWPVLLTGATLAVAALTVCLLAVARPPGEPAGPGPLGLQ